MGKQEYRIKSGKHTRGKVDKDGNTINAEQFVKGDVLPNVTRREWETIGDKLEPVVAAPVFEEEATPEEDAAPPKKGKGK